ncbi:MAG: CHAP domain-containing protein [Clostridia bacterium]
MSKIKTREIVKNIKSLDKTQIASERMKSAFIRSKEQINKHTDYQEENQNEYASNIIEESIENGTSNVIDTASEPIKIYTRRNEKKANVEQIPKNHNKQNPVKEDNSSSNFRKNSTTKHKTPKQDADYKLPKNKTLSQNLKNNAKKSVHKSPQISIKKLKINNKPTKILTQDLKAENKFPINETTSQKIKSPNNSLKNQEIKATYELPKNRTENQEIKSTYELPKNKSVKQDFKIYAATPEKKAIKQDIKNNHKLLQNKTPLKSIYNSHKTLKQKGTTKSVKKTISTHKSIKVRSKSTSTIAKTSQKTSQNLKIAAQKTISIIKATVKAVISIVKLVIVGIKSLVAVIAAGGWVAVIIIVVICLIGAIVGSCFGIFFSGEDTGSGETMQTVVAEINTDYQTKIDSIKASNTYDNLEISGSKAVWSDVLSIYAVSTTSETDVATMDDERKTILEAVFWEMNAISHYTNTTTYTEIIVTDDGEGNLIEEEIEVSETTLYIVITHKTTDEMASEYSFTDDEHEMLAELLSDEYNSLWSQVLYGITSSSEDIVAVALSQVGNSGETYWSWYGFSSSVEWCACFVSWCANECGYIEAGVIPKFAACTSQGMPWFQERGQWQDSYYEPQAGDIIFFDWDNSGNADHVGIVEKCENGIVYTIEGNSGDMCKQKQYSVGSSVIAGYGIPAY